MCMRTEYILHSLGLATSAREGGWVFDWETVKLIPYTPLNPTLSSPCAYASSKPKYITYQRGLEEKKPQSFSLSCMHSSLSFSPLLLVLLYFWERSSFASLVLVFFYHIVWDWIIMHAWDLKKNKTNKNKTTQRSLNLFANSQNEVTIFFSRFLSCSLAWEWFGWERKINTYTFIICCFFIHSSVLSWKLHYLILLCMYHYLYHLCIALWSG